MKNIWIILIAICSVLIQKSYYEKKIEKLTQDNTDLIVCEQQLDQMQDTCDDLIADAVEQAKEEVLSMF